MKPIIEITRRIRIHNIPKILEYDPEGFEGFSRDSRDAIPQLSINSLNSVSNRFEELSLVISRNIEAQLDYASIARRLFQNVTLGPGQIPIFNYGELDRIGRLSIPPHPLVSESVIRYNDISTSSTFLQLLQQYIERTVVQIADLELGVGIAEIRRNTQESANNLIEAIVTLRSNYRISSSILINYASIDNIMRTYPNAFQPRNGSGREIGVIWGANVYADNSISTNEAFVISAPENLGVMAIRNRISTTLYNDPRSMTYRLTATESVGFGVLYRNSVMTVPLETN